MTRTSGQTVDHLTQEFLKITDGLIAGDPSLGRPTDEVNTDLPTWADLDTAELDAWQAEIDAFTIGVEFPAVEEAAEPESTAPAAPVAETEPRTVPSSIFETVMKMPEFRHLDLGTFDQVNDIAPVTPVRQIRTSTVSVVGGLSLLRSDETHGDLPATAVVVPSSPAPSTQQAVRTGVVPRWSASTLADPKQAPTYTGSVAQAYRAVNEAVANARRNLGMRLTEAQCAILGIDPTTVTPVFAVPLEVALADTTARIAAIAQEQVKRTTAVLSVAEQADTTLVTVAADSTATPGQSGATTTEKPAQQFSEADRLSEARFSTLADLDDTPKGPARGQITGKTSSILRHHLQPGRRARRTQARRLADATAEWR